MLLQEYKNLLDYENKYAIHLMELEDKSDRTLIYGYTCDRDTFHLYLQNGIFKVVTYGYPDIMIGHFIGVEEIRGVNCLPNKRVYPECCDYNFCQLLQAMHITVPYTVYTAREPKQYYGLLLEELK